MTSRIDASKKWDDLLTIKTRNPLFSHGQLS